MENLKLFVSLAFLNLWLHYLPWPGQLALLTPIRQKRLSSDYRLFNLCISCFSLDYGLIFLGLLVSYR